MTRREQTIMDIRVAHPCTRTRMTRLGIAVALAAILTAFLVVAVGNRRVTASHLATPDLWTSLEADHSSASLASSLLVANDAGYWPMGYLSGTQVVGHDIDLMNAIAAEMSVTVVYTIVPWVGIFDGLIAGEYDAIIDALTVTPEREEVIDFTLPYVILGGEEDIAIAVQQGDDVLRHQMNEALCQLRIGGTLESIRAAIASDQPEWQPRLPAWTCSSVLTDTESTLIYTDTQGSPTILSVPAGAVTDTTELVYIPLETVTPPSGFAFAGHTFNLEAYRGDSLLPGLTLGVPATITIHYTDSDVAVVDENSLELRYWNGDAWVTDGITLTEHNTAQKHIVFEVAHLSQFALFGEVIASIDKSGTPTGPVHYGDELVYTLVISAVPGTQVALYDPLESTTFVDFVERPDGVTHIDTLNGTLYLGGVITGTLEVTPTNQVTVSFVARVGVPGTVGWTADVTNRACVFPLGGTLGTCIWSNEVTNPAFRPYEIYLPLVLRNH